MEETHTYPYDKNEDCSNSCNELKMMQAMLRLDAATGSLLKTLTPNTAEFQSAKEHLYSRHTSLYSPSSATAQTNSFHLCPF